MAIKIIKRPSRLFRIECQTCEAVLEYSLIDIRTGAIQCPCCETWNEHLQRKNMPKESEDTK